MQPLRVSRSGHQVGDVSHFTEVIHEGLDCVGGQEPHHLLQGQWKLALIKVRGCVQSAIQPWEALSVADLRARADGAERMAPSGW